MHAPPLARPDHGRGQQPAAQHAHQALPHQEAEREARQLLAKNGKAQQASIAQAAAGAMCHFSRERTPLFVTTGSIKSWCTTSSSLYSSWRSSLACLCTSNMSKPQHSMTSTFVCARKGSAMQLLQLSAHPASSPPTVLPTTDVDTLCQAPSSPTSRCARRLRM